MRTSRAPGRAASDERLRRILADVPVTVGRSGLILVAHRHAGHGQRRGPGHRRVDPARAGRHAGGRQYAPRPVRRRAAPRALARAVPGIQGSSRPADVHASSSEAPSVPHEQGRPRLFGRTRHVRRRRLAQGAVRRRGRDPHRRPRRRLAAPGRRGAGDVRRRHRAPTSSTPASASSPTSSGRTCRPTRSTRAPIRWPRRSPGRSSRSSSSRSPSARAPTRSPTAAPARATTRSASTSRPTRLDPGLEVIAPMRVGMGLTRDQEIDYANERGIEIPITKASPYSIDVNLWGRSCETGVLEDPWVTPPPDAYEWTVAPGRRARPGRGRRSSSRAASRSPSTASGWRRSTLVERLHDLGGAHGVGRIDHVEDRLVGIKSREIYETPAATILHAAHHALEGLTLSRDTLRFNRFVADELARLIYDGLWFSALSRDLRSLRRRRRSGSCRARSASGSTTARRSSPGGARRCRCTTRASRRTTRATRSTTPRPSASSRSSACRCGSRRRATAPSASATARPGPGRIRCSTAADLGHGSGAGRRLGARRAPPPWPGGGRPGRRGRRWDPRGPAPTVGTRGRRLGHDSLFGADEPPVGGEAAIDGGGRGDRVAVRRHRHVAELGQAVVGDLGRERQLASGRR